MIKPHVSLIAAVGPNWELGLRGGMPWGRISRDMKSFVEHTSDEQTLIVCGRTTWLGLPGRAKERMGARACVLSRTLDDEGHNQLKETGVGYTADHMADFRETWGFFHSMIIIGGAQVYREALELDLVDVIHLSIIHNPQGWEHDVVFPDLTKQGWVQSYHEHPPACDGAPFGWTRGRLIRDPMHPALEATDGRDTRPTTTLLTGCDK